MRNVVIKQVEIESEGGSTCLEEFGYEPRRMGNKLKFCYSTREDSNAMLLKNRFINNFYKILLNIFINIISVVGFGVSLPFLLTRNFVAFFVFDCIGNDVKFPRSFIFVFSACKMGKYGI